MPEDPYVIIGNGVAGVNAAEAIRVRDRLTPVTIITDQECAFYSRPSLYYVLLNRIALDDAFARPEDFYEANGVDLRCRRRVVGVDAKAQRIETDGGEQIPYRAMLLATGTRGRRLPWAEQGLHGVVELNTIMDVLEIRRLLPRSRRAVVIGGGLTSIEVTEVMRYWGIETTFIMRGDRFLRNQLTVGEAELIHERLRAGGVTLRPEEQIVDVRGDQGHVSAAVPGSGDEIQCDIVASCIGVIPETVLAEQMGVEVNGAIITDDRMRTGAPNVYAAGDAARVRQGDGTLGPVDLLWYVAADQGEVAGANMAGGDEVYRGRVFMNVAEFCDLDFCGVGDIDPEQSGVENVTVQTTGGEGRARIVLRDGVIVGGCFLGDIRLGDTVRGLIAAGVRLDELGADHPLQSLVGR